MTTDDLIVLRFAGENISPEKVSLRVLSRIFEYVEATLSPVIHRDHPELSSEALYLSLVQISEGSSVYAFKPSHPEYALPAYQKITKSIAADDYTDIPLESIDVIKDMIGFTKQLNCETHFYQSLNAMEQPLATLLPTTVITVQDSEYIKGETVIYGFVQRVGGTDPRVRLKIPNQRTISCSVNQQLAKEIATRLYDTVGLFGIATWNIHNYSLERFEAKSLTEYRDVPVTQAFRELSEKASHHFDGIDPVDFVSDHREE